MPSIFSIVAFHLPTMKHCMILAFLLGSLLAVSLAAPANEPSKHEITVESLKARIQTAEDNLLIIFEVVQGRGHANLLGSLKNLQHTLKALSQRLDRHDSAHYLEQYNTQLKRLEDRIQDEFSHVLKALNNHKRVESTRAALILIGHELVDKASALMKHHNHDKIHGHIFDEMKSEIEQINALMTKIGASDMVNEKDERQLYRHELTMAKLFEEFHTTK